MAEQTDDPHHPDAPSGLRNETIPGERDRAHFLSLQRRKLEQVQGLFGITQVNIGHKVTCSCGIVIDDHCIHTLYVMLKKYRVPETQPIIWQGSFSFLL